MSSDLESVIWPDRPAAKGDGPGAAKSMPKKPPAAAESKASDAEAKKPPGAAPAAKPEASPRDQV